MQKTHRTGKSLHFTDAALKNARRLRKEMTGVEKLVWHHLRRGNLHGVRFRKQVPVGKYIADFLSYDPKLIIELDGGQHADAIGHDLQRDHWLRQQGFCVLRFWNNEVIENLDGVLTVIQNTVMELRQSYA